MKKKSVRNSHIPVIPILSFFLLLLAIGLLIFQLSKAPKEVKAVAGDIKIGVGTAGAGCAAGEIIMGGGTAVKSSCGSFETAFASKTPKFAGLSVTGNVGIGTTGPESDLTVKDTNYGITIIPLSGGTAYNSLYIGHNSANKIIGANVRTKVGVWDVVNHAYASSHIDFNGTAGDSYLGQIDFVTRPAGDASDIGYSRMTILATGNVGIGTTAPGAKLDIANGTVRPWLNTITESALPPSGISFQTGPGGGNGPYGWSYPYGTKLSVFGSSGRNFEIMTTTYPNGQLVLRDDNGAGVWSAWRTMIDSTTIGSQSVNYANTAGSAPANGGTSSAVSGLTLTSSANGINPDNVTQNQLGYNTSVSLFGQGDGGLYSSAYNSSWVHQIYGDFRTGQIAIRGKNSGTWQAWRTVIDSGTIGSQSVNYAASAGNADTLDGYHKENFPRKDGGSYYQFDTWLQSTGTHGLYFPSSGAGTHWYPNTSTSYGSFMMEGTKGGYTGILFGAGTDKPNLMFSGAYGGLYYENWGWEMYINGSNKNIGWRTSDTSYAMTVSGVVYASGSSRDYKQNIKNLEVDSSKIYDLQPVSFDYKKEYKDLGYTLAGGRQFGLIAEDTYKVIPELVISKDDKKTANIDYEKLSVLLLVEMKNQKKEIDSLKSDVSNLKKDIEVIKQTLKTNEK